MSLCQKPFLKRPRGVTETEWLISEEARNAATPFPCGKCENCRINRARVWKHRIMLEMLCHRVNIFVTLTYNPSHLPPLGSLRPRDLTLFLKRLRKKHSFRYFAVGEYGRQNIRPHYHLLLFGLDIDCHADIFKAWHDEEGEYGFVQTGPLESGGVGYVCGYVVKGLLYEGDPLLKGRGPEFMRCSKRPGIGAGAVDQVAAAINMSRFKEEVGEVSELQHGKNSMPLGRYLSKKLSDSTELTTKGLRLLEYQSELQALNSGDQVYYDALQMPDSAAREQRKLRYHFFKKTRSI